MKRKFRVMAGPCVIESEELVMETAEYLAGIVKGYDIDFYFKASFDKANRTSMDSFRGPGMEEGLRILEKVKDTYGLQLVTDIHEAIQAAPVSRVVDIIQIPAFLCRQTDLLQAAAETGKCIHVKKAQFLAPWDMEHVIEKLRLAGNEDILICERGTSFGYNRLVVDMSGILELKRFGYPVIYDATHSVQKPGGNKRTTGGNRGYVKYLARAAAAVGIDGLFAEVHPDPDAALSDGANMISLRDFPKVLEEILAVHHLVEEFKE